ncbi:MAG: porin [Methanoregulaceae archaeon]|nr:porin [Methanoregulaceae archaeon]
MKKLLCSAAVAGLCAVAAAPAMAQGDQSALELSLGGYFRGYVTYASQDTAVGAGEERHIDILRDTEIHFTGETTLDNGLTVGV